jgi:hypothetical protein
VFDQAQSVGLVQGISGFTTQFCPDETCQSLTTKKHKLSFFSPEEDFFIVVMVAVPKSEGEKEIFYERELEPQMLKSAVRQAYDAFYFLHGKLGDQMEKLGPDGLRSLLKSFMSEYLSVLDFSKRDVFGVLDGVSFLPMERSIWMRCQCVVNEAEDVFPELEKSAFFYRENLVCSSAEVEALRPVYRYIFAYPAHAAQVKQDAQTPKMLVLSHKNRQVRLDGKELYMLVFKVGEAMVVFFVSKLDSVDEMMKFLVSRVRELVPEMQASYDKMMKNQGSHRFVYYNSMNWAIKNFMGGSRRITRDSLNVIASMHTSLDHANEIVARHGANFVLAKKVGERELYVIFENTNDTLLDVEAKCTTITENVLGSIYF